MPGAPRSGRTGELAAASPPCSPRLPLVAALQKSIPTAGLGLYHAAGGVRVRIPPAMSGAGGGSRNGGGPRGARVWGDGGREGERLPPEIEMPPEGSAHPRATPFLGYVCICPSPLAPLCHPPTLIHPLCTPLSAPHTPLYPSVLLCTHPSPAHPSIHQSQLPPGGCCTQAFYQSFGRARQCQALHPSPLGSSPPASPRELCPAGQPKPAAWGSPSPPAGPPGSAARMWGAPRFATHRRLGPLSLLGSRLERPLLRGVHCPVAGG